MGMIYHVLPGDSLVREFEEAGIEGKAIVFRECLVDGDISAASLDEFWNIRANFIELEYGGDPIQYRESVAYELERLTHVDDDDEINLWFEYELFCSANMWFCLDLLKGCGAKVFRVMPVNVSPDDVWMGFSQHDAEGLKACFESRTAFTPEDLIIGSNLWHAFADKDSETLRDLGKYRSPSFPFLEEVTKAAAEIDHRPMEVIREVMETGATEMSEVFPEFKKRAGVYGFGDSQVERLLGRV